MDNIKWHDSDLIKNIKNKINGKYPIEKIFTPTFMKKYIKCSNNFDEFVSKSGFKLKEFELKPNKYLDDYIRKNANQFNSWRDMYEKAIGEYIETIKI